MEELCEQRGSVDMQTVRLTLGCGLAIGACQGDHALVHFDPHHHALLFDELGEQLPTVIFLVQRLVEEDDPTDAGVDAFIGGEQQLPV